MLKKILTALAVIASPLPSMAQTSSHVYDVNIAPTESTYTDSSGSWTLKIDALKLGTLTFVPSGTIPPPITTTTYVIQNSNYAVDGGFGYWGEVPAVQLYSLNSGTGQQWKLDGSKLSNVMVAANKGKASGPYLAEATDGTATENATGDTFTITISGSGSTIKDDRTGHYLQKTNTTLGFVSTTTPTVWTLTIK